MPHVPCVLTKEEDDGNVEYKLRLKVPTTVRFQQLVRSPPMCNQSSPARLTRLGPARLPAYMSQSAMVWCRFHGTALLHALAPRSVQTSCAGVIQQVTQLKYRLSEGNGECFYYIGDSRCSYACICYPVATSLSSTDCPLGSKVPHVAVVSINACC